MSEDWDILMQEAETGTWFQSEEAWRFYCACTEWMTPFHTEVRRGKRAVGMVTGYISKEKRAWKQRLSCRAIIFGGPLLAQDATIEEVKRLLRETEAEIQRLSEGRVIYIETRNFVDLSPWREAFEACGWEYRRHYDIHVDCRDGEAMWGRIHESKRRAITHAGVEVERSRGVGDVDQWYSLLEELYKKKVHRPLWPKEFFEKAIEMGVGELLVVYANKVRGVCEQSSRCMQAEPAVNTIEDTQQSINSDSIHSAASTAQQESVRMRAKMLCMQVMMGQERQRRALEEVWRAIEGTGVKPVLLKGFGLAQLYPLPYLRQWGDADIWVGHGHYEEVTEAICKTMEVTWHHESEEENERHYNFNTKDGFVFEIHPQTIRWVLPKEDRIYRAIEAKAMEECETIEIEGTKYRVPERGFNQLFVFLHAWEHCTSSGTNMKQLSDLALLCQRERLPKELYEVLKPLHMLEPWEVMGYVVVKAFGIEKERWTGYKESPRIRRLGERLYREILKKSELKICSKSVDNPFLDDFASLRNLTKNLTENQNKILRKIGTLMTRIEKGREIKRYCPKYGRHYVWMAIVKGVRRLGVE